MSQEGIYLIKIALHLSVFMADTCTGIFVGCDFSWRSLFVSSEEDGVTYVCLRCVVSSLSVVSPLAKFVRNKRRMKK